MIINKVLLLAGLCTAYFSGQIKAEDFSKPQSKVIPDHPELLARSIDIRNNLATVYGPNANERSVFDIADPKNPVLINSVLFDPVLDNDEPENDKVHNMINVKNGKVVDSNSNLPLLAFNDHKLKEGGVKLVSDGSGNSPEYEYSNNEGDQCHIPIAGRVNF